MKPRSLCAPFLIIIAFITDISNADGFDYGIYENKILAEALHTEYMLDEIIAPRRDEFTPFAFTENISVLPSTERVIVASLGDDGRVRSSAGTAFAAGSRFTALTAAHVLYSENLSSFALIVTLGDDFNQCDAIVHKTYQTVPSTEKDIAVIFYKNRAPILGTHQPLSVAFGDEGLKKAMLGLTPQNNPVNNYVVGFPGACRFQYYADESWRFLTLPIADDSEQKMIHLKGGANRYFLDSYGLSEYFKYHAYGPKPVTTSVYKNLGEGQGSSGSAMIASEHRLDGINGLYNQGTEFATGIVSSGGGDFPDPVNIPQIIDSPSKVYFNSDYRMQTLMINTALQIMGEQHRISDFPSPQFLHPSHVTPPNSIGYYNAAIALRDEMGIEEIPINMEIAPHTPTLLTTITLDFAERDQTGYKNTMPGLLLPWLIFWVDNEDDLNNADIRLTLTFKSYDIEYEEDFHYRTSLAPISPAAPEGSSVFDLTNFRGATGRDRVLDSLELGENYQIWITTKRPISIRDPLLLKHIERTY